MLNRAQNIIKKLPPPMEMGARYLYAALPVRLRACKTFWRTYRFLRESEYWTEERHYEHQLQRLREIVALAYHKVPWYRRRYREAGFEPGDLKSLEDMKKLPWVTKEDIRDNLEEFLVDGFPKEKLTYVTTGGSTGIPVGFYQVAGYSSAVEQAFIVNQWERVGYRLGDRSIVLRGAFVGDESKGRYWRFDPVRRELHFSSYHLTDKAIPLYIGLAKRFRPAFMQAYPSAAEILARYILDNGIKDFPPLKAVLAGSENLYPGQRKLLESVFRARVFSWYGHAEQVVLAAECERSRAYHIYPQYGFTEIIDAHGREVTENGQIGEIVGTGFYNPAMPLIRYRTMDLGVVNNKKCKCGRSYRLLERVEGRLQELIVTKTGRLISMTAINMHSDVFDNVKQFQFYQDTRGQVVFNVVPKPTYTERDTECIRTELTRKLGPDVDLEIRLVEAIPRTKSGKFRFLIQRLPIGLGDIEEQGAGPGKAVNSEHAGACVNLKK